MNKLQENIAEWKKKYIAFSLPETLLDELIAEATVEWDATIPYWVNNNYEMLTINISDSPLGANEFYKILIGRGETIFRGVQTNEIRFLFAQAPTTELIIQVYRIKFWTEPYFREIITGLGYALFQHTKVEELTIEMNSSSGAYFGNQTHLKMQLVAFTPVTDNLNIGFTVIEFELI